MAFEDVRRHTVALKEDGQEQVVRLNLVVLELHEADGRCDIERFRQSRRVPQSVALRRIRTGRNLLLDFSVDLLRVKS